MKGIVKDFVIYKGSDILVYCAQENSPEECPSIVPSLSGTLFDEAQYNNNTYGEKLNSIKYNNKKFIIVQRPTYNSVVATTLNQRQTVVIVQIYTNCFALVLIERSKTNSPIVTTLQSVLNDLLTLINF